MAGTRDPRFSFAVNLILLVIPDAAKRRSGIQCRFIEASEKTLDSRFCGNDGMEFSPE
jgi:hypothetical protein